MKSKLHLTLGVVFACTSFSVAQQTSTTVWDVTPTDPITPGNWSVGPWTAGVPTTDSLAGILNGDTVTLSAAAPDPLEQLLISGGSTLNLNALVEVQGTNGIAAVPPDPAVPATGLFVATGTLNVNANGQLMVNSGGNFTIGNGGAGILSLAPDGLINTDRLVTLGTTGGSAIINQTGGDIMHSTNEFRIGTGGAPVTYNLSGGTLAASFMKLGHGSNAAVTVNQSGGEVTVELDEKLTNTALAIGWDGSAGGSATYNLSDGTLTALAARTRIGIGNNGPRTQLFNQTGGTATLSKLEIGEKVVSDSTYAISGGELTVTAGAVPCIIVGSNSDGFGKFNVSGTAIVNVKGINVGNDNAASGTVTVSGGTINCTDRIRLRTGSVAMTNLFDQTGGTVNSTNRVDIGDGTKAFATCIYQISGGALNMTGGDKRILVGFGATSATGSFTMSGTAMVDANLVMGEGAGATGTINLNGGTLTTGGIQAGTGVPANQVLNLNGVTLKPRAAGNTLIAGNVTTATLQSGGVTVDSNGLSANLNAVLTGTGGLTKTGAGTLTVNSVQTYTGDTTINGGTLALPNVPAVIAPAASLTGTSVDASNVVEVTDTTGLVPGQTVTGPGFTGTVTITAVTSSTTVTASTNATSANGAGAGTFNFGALNAAARLGGIADAGTVRINGVDSRLSLATGINDTVNALFIDGTPAAAGTWGSTASAADNKNDDHFSGEGILNCHHRRRYVQRLRHLGRQLPARERCLQQGRR
jgi:autotransporter-associated beta strand protein